MDSSPASTINDLVERRTIEDYGTFSVVTVPGSSKLADPVRNELFTRIQQKEPMAPASELDTALLFTLERMTPPVDEEAEDEESRSKEATARNVLKLEGCPPCYPSYLDIPLRDPPEKYQEIISYWKSFPGTGDVVLQAQLSDWKRFREFQKRVRRYYEHRSFNDFVDQVRERRRRHRLGGNVCLRLDLEQSRLETWIEFQNWHLQHLEGFEKDRNELKKELYNAWKVAEEMGAADSEAYKQDLEDAEWELRRHHTLLHWTEQERLVMDTAYPTPVEEKDGDYRDAGAKAVRRVFPLTRRKKQAPAVSGEVRVSKAKQRKQNTPRQKRKSSEFESATKALDTLESKVLQASKRRENKPRRTKTDTPLRELRPQRVSKTKRFTDVNAKLPQRARRKRSPDQARSNSGQFSQRPQPAYVEVKTRFGRVSRRSEK